MVIGLVFAERTTKYSSPFATSRLEMLYWPSGRTVFPTVTACGRFTITGFPTAAWSALVVRPPAISMETHTCPARINAFFISLTFLFPLGSGLACSVPSVWKNDFRRQVVTGAVTGSQGFTNENFARQSHCLSCTSCNLHWS